ncbi:SRPBCC family protein [Capnocytophaga cynodegmi]|uniref:SRPBCC family protein n=1 Tax=Capnocytophaga cynodegmi TaxID=28189 RepID=UPI001BB35F52|nr:SRPBCC family protein [Capnocytophaga cynodegmi]
MLYIILSGFLLLVLVFVLIGILLPRTRTETKQCILNASVDVVFAIVTNNQEWHYRSSLDDLKIIRTQGDIEEWEEIANGVTIRFKTLDKRPHSFYRFEMDSKMFTGEWQATFEPVEEGKTLFSATEKIEYKNLLYRLVGYAFMDLNKFMTTYQEELTARIKLEKAVQ